MKKYSISLEDKLNTIAAGQAIGLTATEAAVYGVDYPDEQLEDNHYDGEVEDER